MSRTHEVRSPWSGDVVDAIELASDDAVEQALARAVGAHRDFDRRLPRHERARILRAVSARVRNDREARAALIAREGGKPWRDALVEVDRAASGLEFLAGEAERVAGVEVPMGASAATEGRLAMTTLEPVGVVLAVSAFNHPLNLIVHQLGAAVAAGCPAIVKPALETPLSAQWLVREFVAAGLPNDFATLVMCENDVAERIVRDPRVAYLSFIGSAAVGWRLRGIAAPGTRVGFEHGGAAPVVVDASADLEAATPWLLKGGYYHAGQVCVSVQRVLCHASRADELAERLARGAKALVVGDPIDPATDVGPLIRARDVERVESWVDEARARGAALACGGQRVATQAYAPTLLVDSPDDARVAREEIFGPVIALRRVAELDEAVRLANDTRWAFQAAVLSRDLDRALWAARRLDASAVLVNDHTAFRADWMPFGGRRESGLGLGGLSLGVHELCAPKLLVLRA
jgi:acyl-CoA reductase-like NAD-dependent aldehyde dehydrogenase